MLRPGEGRHYDMGQISAVFKVDEDESDSEYSVSEWRLEPNTEGPGPHHHDANEEIFYVTDGTASFLIGDEWVDAEQGSLLRIPAGIQHDFANRTDSPCAVLNVFIPGGFERDMPTIVDWFAKNR